jgi:peptidoglycan/LPS O-acetylase OafA/YrhL
MKYLGAISFPLYLVHLLTFASVGCLLFAWSYDRFGLEAARWITIPVTFAVAIGLATILTVLVEKPSVTLAKLAGDRTERWVKSIGWLPFRARQAAR